MNTSGWLGSPSMPPEAALMDKMKVGEDQEALWCQGMSKEAALEVDLLPSGVLEIFVQDKNM